MKKQIKIVIIFAILIQSCFKYRLVDLDDIKSPQIPVVNCLFTADSTFKVWIGLTTNYFESQPVTLDEAEVLVISQDGDTLYFHKRNEHIYESDSVAKRGVIYKLYVKTQKYGTITAQSSIPLSGPKIDSIIIFNNQFLSEYSHYARLYFQDFKNTRNYYQLSCLKKVLLDNLDSCYFISVNLKCTSPIFLKEKFDIVNTLKFITFSDISYENKTIILDFYLSPGTLTYKDNIIFYLKNISEEYYLYQKSLTKKSNINSSEFDNFITSGFFIQNRDIYTNIVNGLGIFAGYNNDSYVIISDSDINKK